MADCGYAGWAEVISRAWTRAEEPGRARAREALASLVRAGENIGPGHRVLINAEPMADALIEALEARDG